ncbi:MAG: AFG1 family ATPase [Proteobacteria bacterium]|nr:AFG1 family ATPase [Pseudomonadota bacterium]
MTPLQRYQSFVQEGKIKAESCQEQILIHLDKLYHSLISQSDFLSIAKSSLFRSLGFRQVPIKGIYLWGGVGRGKTFLMDLFFQSLPFAQKTRLHFHRFMLFVHEALNRHQGEKDPLKVIAKEFASTSWVLCFDEFYVKDISDAMILSQLLDNLFHQGVTLIATSNLEPHQLYENGLQRDKFLPAIALICQHTHVLEIGGNEDYRLSKLSHTDLYHYPLDEKAEENLNKYFLQLAPLDATPNKRITIAQREVPTRYCSEGIVWFSFEVLCMSARSTIDYIEIARCYKTVFISGVQVMGEDKEDVALRFIALVDEFYDHRVSLVMSAQVPITALYQGQRHHFEFQRTISRLTEMRSPSYIAKMHVV